MTSAATAIDPPLPLKRLGNALAGSLRAFWVVSWILSASPLIIFACLFVKPAPYGFLKFFYRMILRLMGLRLRVFGEPFRGGQVIYVANHTTTLDIGTLGSLLNARFVSKAEVRGWPVIGDVAKATGSLFIDRQSREVGAHRHLLQTAIDAGDSLILFPEGTTSDGNRVLPFKSALFDVATTKPDLWLQPITISPTRMDGLPLMRLFRPLCVWCGDMTLVTHLWGLMCVGNIGIDVLFHPPFRTHGQSRKALAQQCEIAVRHGAAALLSGRLEALPSHESGSAPQKPV